MDSCSRPTKSIGRVGGRKGSLGSATHVGVGEVLGGVDAGVDAGNLGDGGKYSAKALAEYFLGEEDDPRFAIITGVSKKDKYKVLARTRTHWRRLKNNRQWVGAENSSENLALFAEDPVLPS